MMSTGEKENEYFGTFVFKYRHTFYAERPDGKYKKINYRSSDDYVSDLKDVEEVLSEDIDKYATLGEDLYICDKNKQRVAVCRYTEDVSKCSIFVYRGRGRGIYSYSKVEKL